LLIPPLKIACSGGIAGFGNSYLTGTTVVLKAKVADMTSGEHDYLGEMTMFRNCSLTGMSFGLV
jgi:hypothetical protein